MRRHLRGWYSSFDGVQPLSGKASTRTVPTTESEGCQELDNRNNSGNITLAQSVYNLNAI